VCVCVRGEAFAMLYGKCALTLVLNMFALTSLSCKINGYVYRCHSKQHVTKIRWILMFGDLKHSVFS
jgi:hypothetical protein